MEVLTHQNLATGGIETGIRETGFTESSCNRFHDFGRFGRSCQLLGLGNETGFSKIMGAWWASVPPVGSRVDVLVSSSFCGGGNNRLKSLSKPSK